MTAPESDEPVDQGVGIGTWRDLLPRLPRPVWAIGKQQLYRVLVAGSGFSLSLTGGGEPIGGFLTTRFVAAANVREAEMKARSSVLREWKRRGYEAIAESSPLLQIEALEPMDSRFRLRSGAGFTFYASEAD